MLVGVFRSFDVGSFGHVLRQSWVKLLRKPLIGLLFVHRYMIRVNKNLVLESVELTVPRPGHLADVNNCVVGVLPQLSVLVCLVIYRQSSVDCLD